MKTNKLFMAVICLLLTVSVSFAQEKLTNQSVIALTGAKISNPLIISKIKEAPNEFDLTAAGIVALKTGKVNDAVVEEMLLASKNLPVVKNEDVIAMTQSKVSKNIILKKISVSKCEFNTNTDGLIALKTANVSEAVTKAMMDPLNSTAAGSAANLTSANIPPHPQDIAPPKNLPAAGIYYEAYNPKKEYIALDPTTTNQAKSGGFGEAVGNHFSHGISGKSERVGLANKSANTVIEDSRPVFYFYVSNDYKDMNEVVESTYDGIASPNDFVLITANVTKKGREVEIGRNTAYSSESGFSKGTVQFRYKKVSDRLFKVYFDGNLPAGEYAFYYNKGSEQRRSLKLYDFSLRNNVSPVKK